MNDDTARVRLAGFAPDSQVNGPGHRVVIWVQGCDLACPGCFNATTHPAEGGGTAVGAVVQRILAARSQQTVGLTFSGGEPFQQAAALALVARGVRRAWPEVQLMAFTGYRLETLRGRSAPDGAAALLSALDLVVDGPYDPKRSSDQAWRASANQRLWVVGRAPARWPRAPAVAEITIGDTGQVLLSGFPDPALRHAIAKLA